MALILILGATALGVVFWKSYTPIKESLLQALAQPPLPQFGYFRALEDRERIISEAEIQDEARSIRNGNPALTGEFTLLVGTYKTRGDIDAIRQRLNAFERLNPKLEQVHLEFSSWFRVKLGPYGKLQEAVQVRSFLKTQGIDSVIETPLSIQR